VTAVDDSIHREGGAAPPRPPRSRAATLVVLACFAVGGALRFVGLTKESFWLDEGWLLSFADHASLRDALRAATHDVHPPLNTVLVWGWIRLFGDSDAAVRSLSALFATAALPAAWLLLRRLATPRAAIVALALAALSPLLVRYAHDARQYSLVVLLATLSTERFLAFAQGRSDRPLLGWAIVTTLLAWTHVVGATTVLAQDVVLLAGWVPRTARPRRAMLGRLAIAHAAVAALVAPWVPFLWASRGDFHGYADSQRVQVLWRAATDVAGTSRGFVLLLAGAAIGLFLRRRRGRAWPRALPAALVLGVVPILLPWAVSAATFPSFATRLGIAGVVPLAAAMGMGLASLARRPSLRLPAALALVVVATGLVRLHPRVEREQWREAAALVAAEAGPHDAVLALGATDAILLRRYLPPGGPPVLVAKEGLPSPSSSLERLFVVPSVHTVDFEPWRRTLREHGWRDGAESALVMIRVVRFTR
jgi:mannosyltransferase